jgi:hypothetical protein
MPALIVEWSVIATWRTMSRTSLTIARMSAPMPMILKNVTLSGLIERLSAKRRALHLLPQETANEASIFDKSLVENNFCSAVQRMEPQASTL